MTTVCIIKREGNDMNMYIKVGVEGVTILT